MPTDDPRDHERKRLPGEESPRLSDGRADLGESFDPASPARPLDPAQRELGEDFTRRNEYDGRELGREFGDPDYADRAALARSFEDPDAQEDAKLGKSFEQTNSSAKKHHKPLKETVEAPFKKPGSKKVLFWVVGIAVLVFLAILILGAIPRIARDKKTKDEASKQQQEPEVEVSKVMRAKDSAGLVVPGTTTPLVEASVYARANGYLKKRYVDIGDHVRKGQLLALIDAPDLDQQVDQAREQVRQAEAQVEQQKSQLGLNKVTNERYQALAARGVFSRQDADQQGANYLQQVANVAASERNLEAFRANLRRQIALQSYERVTAPFDGVITQRNVDEGALIQTSGSAGSNAPTPMANGLISSSTNGNAGTNTGGSSGNSAALATPTTGGAQGGALFSIAQDQRLRILVSVPEGYTELVKPGFPTTLYFQEYPTRVFHGDVTRNAGSIDQNTRTLLTEIQVDNSDRKLLAGMYAVVTFAVPKGQAPLVISGDSIAVRKDVPTVAVVKDGKVHLQPVVIGRDYGAEVEIVSGLQEGDMIASTITDDVQEGAKVRAEQNKQQAEKASQPTPASKPQPPGGSTQYSDPGITDQDMQGQSAKPGQKQGKGATKPAAKGESKQ